MTNLSLSPSFVIRLWSFGAYYTAKQKTAIPATW